MKSGEIRKNKSGIINQSEDSDKVLDALDQWRVQDKQRRCKDVEELPYWKQQTTVTSL